MKDRYDHIYHASDAKLAEILERLAAHAVSYKRIALNEAARRLRVKPHVPFNNEAFE